MLGLSTSSSSVHATFVPKSTFSPHSHVYLFRGLLPVFSSGLREIAAILRKQGISASVHNQSEWPQLAERITRRHRNGDAQTIVLVGYSVGAAAVTNMTARLGEHGIPVKLAISLDPVWPTTAAGKVDRYVNYYNSGSGNSVNRSKYFKGSLQNVDVGGIPGIGHLNLDNNQIVQRKVIRDIRAALHVDRRAVSPKAIVMSGIRTKSSP